MTTYLNRYISFRLLPVFAALVLLSTGCTKKFQEYNTSNLSANIDLAAAYRHIAMGVYNFSGGGDPNSYQLQQNLNADCYSGYFMSQINFASGTNNLNYALVQGWNGEPFKVGYLDIMRYVAVIKGMGTDQNYPGIWAIAQIIQVEAMSRLTDIYGPTPYSKAGPLANGATGTPYDSQQAIYTSFFSDLDAATAALKTFIAAGGVKTLPFDFPPMDLIYGGDESTELQNWLHFANALRLRLALRLVKVDAATAKTQGEKALDPANGGVITANSEIPRVTVPSGNFSNPLAAITINWANICIGASIQCYMTGYNDPRIGKYFDVSTDAASAGQYKGIRIGSNVGLFNYGNYSTINFKDGATPSYNLHTAPVLMTAAEVYFLRAEAALRGWNNAGGTPQALYEQGITTSFAQWGVASSTYITDGASVPDAYTDPLNAANNAPSPSAITVKWDDGASNEEKLERIITQKWIANFPEGQEAWSEFRRTGYPKLFPVVQNNSGGAISTTVQIRRLPFSQNEYNTNNAEVQKAIQLLSVPADNGGTRLWWDVDKGNF
ncbi:SusD/RagB family nutrient-binding outer membrane lipoprotein [Flavitalea sp. BT771]|uniref:SusD/RagB family nutrient-binding outer membrane lipoprotein n=1 Tax=Flavitalea sp. BT771 TaxID=3063329 RepID=UPI0026E2C2F8|nr:SusD/RagB family nutrient-binding outer membrane lipoprotein [Flavitalea sp. BT771]MDO6435154.1 SusD/RagB family nutrient-binding outer membrane lipoprotein [Flavitalea sp. BT771]MDV6224141.1 SusD/RagB family nutrient-binding outer membrane lipoprotein [Flavitalea sp. BT771]